MLFSLSFISGKKLHVVTCSDMSTIFLLYAFIVTNKNEKDEATNIKCYSAVGVEISLETGLPI